MKKTISILICIMMLIGSFAVFANDDQPITVTVDGEKLEFDVEPFIENDRTLVPMRAIFQALGCSVDYTAADGKEVVTARRADDVIILVIGSNEMTVNDQTVILDVSAKIVNDRTFIPLRAVSEALNETVNWIEDTCTVEIIKTHGDHRIAIRNIIKSGDKYEISMFYPYIEDPDGNEFIASLNAEVAANAQSLTAKKEAELAEEAKGIGDNIDRLFYTETFKVDTDSKGIYSVTRYIYEYHGGAHPLYILDSKNYDFNANSSITLAQALNMDEKDVENFVYSSFAMYFDGDENYAESIEPLLKEAAKNVNYRIIDDYSEVELYFNQYEIAPYSYGIPKVTLMTEYEDADKYSELLEIIATTEIGTAGSTEKAFEKFLKIAEWYKKYKPSQDEFEQSFADEVNRLDSDAKEILLAQARFLCETYRSAYAMLGFNEVLSREETKNISVFAACVYELSGQNVVRPLKETYSSDATYTAYIKGVKDGELTADVYVISLYDAVDISKLNIGDIIVGSNGVFPVETKEEANGTLVINGGLENMGIDIVSYGGGTFAEKLWDDDYAMTCLGEYTYSIADDVALEDSSDLDAKEPTKVTGKDKVAEYITSGEVFGTFIICFENNVIKEIKVIYHP